MHLEKPKRIVFGMEGVGLFGYSLRIYYFITVSFSVIDMVVIRTGVEVIQDAHLL
jgi:hypothetical protein